MTLLRINVHENTGTIIINRPERRNAVSRDLLRDLVEAFGDLHLERRVRAVIVTGAGSTFCAGMDLAEMRATKESNDPRRPMARRFGAVSGTSRNDAPLSQAHYRGRQWSGRGGRGRTSVGQRHRRGGR